ncbi:hypothetical protein ACHAW6_007506 [Cyclotella cf. meneghiniana]
MHHNHTFGCPVYVLNNALVAGGKIPKWSPQSRLGINLGPSPHHGAIFIAGKMTFLRILVSTNLKK